MDIKQVENIIKNAYLPVFCSLINTSDKILKKIKNTKKDVYGKEIIRTIPIGENTCAQIERDLKNNFIEIFLSDNALKSCGNSITALVELLNQEFQNAIRIAVRNKLKLLYAFIRESCETNYTVRTIRKALKMLDDDYYEEILYHQLCDWRFLEDSDGSIFIKDKTENFKMLVLANYGDFTIPRGVMCEIKNNIDKIERGEI